jgi:acyl carrier protein
MTRDQFLLELDDLLEQPKGTLRGPEQLAEMDLWDSTAMIGFIALVDTHTGKNLSPRDLTKCETVSDLVTLAGL